MERFIGKRVNVVVAFSDYTLDGGAISKEFIGVLEKCDGDYIEISDVQKVHHGLGGTSYSKYSNYTVINKQYLTMVSEV